jgi:hypothetical protein
MGLWIGDICSKEGIEFLNAIAEEINYSNQLESKISLKSSDQGEGTYSINVYLESITKHQTLIFSFFIAEFPFNCTFIVIGGVDFRLEYVSKMYMEDVKERLARELGYTAIIQTTTTKQSYQNEFLRKNGYEIITELQNKRTSNINIMWKKVLKEE